MSEPDWYGRPTLLGPRLRLTPLSASDAPDYLAALGSAEDAAAVFEHLRPSVPTDLAGAAAIIAEAVGDPDRIAYAQRLRNDVEGGGQFVGTTSFYEIAPDLRSLAIGHTWLARAHWGGGLNAESKLIMLRRAFDELDAERVVWHTDIRNVRSQAAIARLGATREGVLRHHRIRRDGSWRDTVQFSMLRQEWPAAKARLVDRLPVRVVRVDAESRYEAWIGAELVGRVEIADHRDRVLITHTGTVPEWRGCGIAARLTREVLDDLRGRGLRVRPLCSYTRSFIRAHPEYADVQ